MIKEEKLINKILLRAKQFVDSVCCVRGAPKLRIFNEADGDLYYDFAYFGFTKSTRSLISIKELLSKGQINDTYILIRTVFESYLSIRYFNEKYDDEMYKDFVLNPYAAYKRIIVPVIEEPGKAKIRKEDGWMGDERRIAYKQYQPSELLLGKDKSYFYDFYNILCNYAHCNYSISDDYIDESNEFIVDKELEKAPVLLFVIFVYYKLFKLVVEPELDELDPPSARQSTKLLIGEMKNYLETEFGRHKFRTAGGFKEYEKHYNKMIKEMRKTLGESFADN